MLEMRSTLNEIKRLQKIAGIIKEDIHSNMTIHQFVKALNKLANSMGFYATDKSADLAPKSGVSGARNLVKWEDDNDNIVELYTTALGKNVTVDDLEINFDGPVASGNDPASIWLDPKTWQHAFSEETENEEEF